MTQSNRKHTMNHITNYNINNNMKQKTLGIYLHIPFCVRKCNYCDFLSAPTDARTAERYVARLAEEIRRFEPVDEYQVRSVFFGGGTPSLLKGEFIEAVMEQLYEHFPYWDKDPSGGRSAECTIECNPGTLTEDRLSSYRSCGINRLSIGLQSAVNEELRLLGRIHTWEQFVENYRQARAAGFQNINIDLMSALPGQTAASWRETLERVLDLSPEHISAYSLIIEEGTPFYQIYGEQEDQQNGNCGECTEAERQAVSGNGKDISGQMSGDHGRCWPPLPGEDEERQMYYDTERLLMQEGMQRYEISNYALPGFESRHNSGYWQRIEYVGFGLGASSQLGHLRYKNTECLEQYLAGNFSKYEMQKLTREEEIEETMFLGLRMMQGVSDAGFQEKFGVLPEQIYGKKLEWLTREGLIRNDRGFWKLTGRGIDVSNAVLAEFLLD